jgi:quinoprotein glucose dehydrogenase
MVVALELEGFMRPWIMLAGGVVLSILLTQSGGAQQGARAAAGDWPMYRHDLAGTGYSPLNQITTRNVATLTQAWTYSLLTDAPPDAAASGGRGGAAAGANSEVTPIVVDGVMYLPTANRIVAIQPETGKEIWQHRITGAAPSRRGVAYAPGANGQPARIIVTAGRRLIALNATTGAPAAGFGTDGEVDMGTPYNSVPLLYKDIVVVGANTPPGAIGGVGNPRAYDARTGAKLWEFSSVAQPGDAGHDTWDGDSWKGRLGVNAWPFYFTLDEQRGLLFVPLASPVPGAYGGDRKGANLYGNSVVAVDIRTGKYRWHFQTIHHDLWDADPPAPPALFEITRNGRAVPALAVTTKSGYMYILNRDTGQPIFGVDERPVAKSDVPGEFAFPTQPIPVKPPPLARTSFAPGDLVTAADTTPEHAAACKELVEKSGIYNAGPFTPWAYRPGGADGAAPKTAVVFPGGLGGANWGGLAYDPRSKYLFVVSQDNGALGWIEKGRDGGYDKATPDRPGQGRGTFDVRTAGSVWPCQRPPWGRLIAVNASTGDFAWQVTLGITDGLPENRQRTGRPAMAGAIVTAGGVLFVGSTDDNRFRAFEAASGKELWVAKLERRGNADPLTYQGRNGKQYVAVSATDTLLVYALP